MAEAVRSKKLDQMSKDYMNGVVPTKEIIMEVYAELVELDKTGKLDTDHSMFLHIMGKEADFDSPYLIGGICSVLNIF